MASSVRRRCSCLSRDRRGSRHGRQVSKMNHVDYAILAGVGIEAVTERIAARQCRAILLRLSPGPPRRSLDIVSLGPRIQTLDRPPCGRLKTGLLEGDGIRGRGPGWVRRADTFLPKRPPRGHKPSGSNSATFAKITPPRWSKSAVHPADVCRYCRRFGIALGHPVRSESLPGEKATHEEAPL